MPTRSAPNFRISAPTAPSARSRDGKAAITNDEVATIADRYPDRFAGVAAVDLTRPMHAVRELRRCVRDLGFRALRVVPWLWDLPPSDRRYYPL